MVIKKKLFFVLAGIMILLILIVPEVTEPDRVLQFGNQVSEAAYQFTREIKDNEKTAEYESWFNGVTFSAEGEE